MRAYRDCRNPVLPPELHILDPEAHLMPDGRGWFVFYHRSSRNRETRRRLRIEPISFDDGAS